MLLVIVFSVELNLLPAMGMGPGGSAAWSWDWAHMRHLILPAITLSVIPMGIVTRTVRATVSEIMNRSEEHTSELQSLMRISYAVFCLKKKQKIKITTLIH